MEVWSVPALQLVPQRTVVAIIRRIPILAGSGQQFRNRNAIVRHHGVLCFPSTGSSQDEGRAFRHLRESSRNNPRTKCRREAVTRANSTVSTTLEGYWANGSEWMGARSEANQPTTALGMIESRMRLQHDVTVAELMQLATGMERLGGGSAKREQRDGMGRVEASCRNVCGSKADRMYSVGWEIEAIDWVLNVPPRV